MKDIRRTTLVALGATLALAVTGCGGGDKDSSSSGSGSGGGGAAGGDPIKIGIIADMTGATADVGGPYNRGMLAYIDSINTAGGLNGRKIEATSNDYAYEVPKAEQLYKQYVNDEVVAIQGWGTGDSEALHSKVAQDELPFMSASYAEALTDPKEAPYNFVVAATYSDQIRVALNWINSEAPDAQVAVFHHDSPFGRAPVEDGKKWIAEKGYQLGYQAYAMPAGSPNYAGLLSQAKSQGAKYIIIQNVASPAAQVAKDIKAGGMDMKIVCLNWCSNELFIKTAGNDAAEGHMMVQPIAPLSTNKPGHKAINDYIAKKGIKAADVTVSWVAGWATMEAMAKGIAKAAEGDDLTGPAIKEALETVGAIDVGQLIGGGNVQFSTDSHRGTSSSGTYTVEAGKMVEVEGAAKP